MLHAHNMPKTPVRNKNRIREVIYRIHNTSDDVPGGGPSCIVTSCTPRIYMTFSNRKRSNPPIYNHD